MTTVRVRVPASTSNLGPGFDTLGLALSLANDVTMTCKGLARRTGASGTPKVAVEVSGCGAGELGEDEANLVWTAAKRVFDELGRHVDEARVVCVNRVPLSSGLGSSATACVSGAFAANELCDGPLSKQRLLEIVTEVEGHPDNAAPALWGGLTVCFDRAGQPDAVRPPLRARFDVVACVPEAHVATEAARAALPIEVSHRAATLAVGRAAAVTAMLAGGELDGLAEAMEDTLHQPYRAALVPGMAEALEGARREGALCSFLSGAGPTLAAFVKRGDAGAARRVGQALERCFLDRGVQAQSLVLGVDRKGARTLMTQG